MITQYRFHDTDIPFCNEYTDIRNNFIAAVNLNTRGHSCKLMKQHCTVDTTKFYFSNRIVTIWNSLSEDVVSALSVTAFKNRLSQFTV